MFVIFRRNLGVHKAFPLVAPGVSSTSSQPGSQEAVMMLHCSLKNQVPGVEWRWIRDGFTDLDVIQDDRIEIRDDGKL